VNKKLKIFRVRPTAIESFQGADTCCNNCFQSLQSSFARTMTDDGAVNRVRTSALLRPGELIFDCNFESGKKIYLHH